MKNLFLSILAIVTLTLVSCGGTETKKAATGEAAPTASAAQASASKAISNAPVMSFDKGIHDFGVIQEGSRVETVFTFTNTGKSDLIIQDARGSCGCTVPEYPKNLPIAPGATGEIRVSFDSSNKPNLQQKTVTISANTASGRETLRITAMVTADPAKQKQRDEQANARIENK